MKPLIAYIGSILVVIGALAIPSRADDGMALSREVIELERRVQALEAISVIPQGGNLGGAGEILQGGQPVHDIIPSNPLLSLDLICSVNPVIEGDTGNYRMDLENLHCVRYLRSTPGID